MMKMPNLRSLAGAAAVLCLLAAPAAQATIFSDFLTFDGPQHTPGGIPNQGGGEDKLQDDSLSAFVDVDQSGDFSDGDIIYGMVTLSEINSSGEPSAPVGSDEQIAIVFSAVINGTGSGGSINLDPINDAANPFDLRNLLDPSVADSSLDGDSIAVILSTSTGVDASNPADDPLNWTTAQLSTDFSNGVVGSADWFWEASLGLVEAADFFEFTGSLALGGSERGAFTFQDTAFAVDEWLPVDVLDFGATTHLADATLDVGTVTIASVDEIAAGWTFRDQGSYFVNPHNIPEPGSIALLGLGLALVGFMGRRRRGSRQFQA